MRRYSASHLSKPEIRQQLLHQVGVSNVAETHILVLVAEADLRKMYLEDGFPSMHAYCVGFFHFSRDVASQRIHAARAARDYPILFAAVEEGRLHLSAVRLLAPHLTPENVDELVAAATHRTCEEIEEMIGRRFVRLESLRDGPAKDGVSPHTSGRPEVALRNPPYAARHMDTEPLQLGQLAPEQPVASAVPVQPQPQPEPAVWVALSSRAHELLQYAQALLSHTQPSASLVCERALRDLVTKLERKKFGASARPQKPRESQRPGHIPAPVRRAVWEGSGGRCVVVGENGKRCGARKFLEFDHIIPLARDGKSTVENLRLVCRAHNQQAAEQAFGADFMEKKREEAQAAKPPAPDFRDDLIRGLRSLRIGAREAAIVLETSGALECATIEEAMRAALRCLGPRRRAPSPA